MQYSPQPNAFAKVKGGKMSTSVKCSIQAAAKEATKRLGYDKLKGLQLEVVEGLCGGRDVFAVLTPH